MSSHDDESIFQYGTELSKVATGQCELRKTARGFCRYRKYIFFPKELVYLPISRAFTILDQIAEPHDLDLLGGDAREL